MNNRHCKRSVTTLFQERGVKLIVTSLALLAMTTFTYFPAHAQNQKSEDKTYGQRYELALKMHEIWPTRLKVEQAIDDVARQLPQQDQDSFRAAMRRAIKFEQLEQESIKAMVDVFTEEELKAMVGFYGSAEGRGITAKTLAYQERISPVYTQMLDKALMDTKTGNAPGQIP
jgi:hypothetical protein